MNYDVANGKFHLSEEQAFALADESSPVFLPGTFQCALAATRAAEQLAERFKTGQGLGWHEHHHELFVGTERFFRPGYAANLVSSWIPSLAGIEAKLKNGARVADVGCGLGASTILMAKSYPKSELVGFDYHDKSIETAKQRAKDAGVGDRIRFEVANANSIQPDLRSASLGTFLSARSGILLCRRPWACQRGSCFSEVSRVDLSYSRLPVFYNSTEG